MRKYLRDSIKTDCSKCGNELDRKGQRYCKACHAEYMRENRPKHSDLPPMAKLKANCRSYTNVLLMRGKLVREPCQQCGDENSEAHHHDYTKPREVIWLCRKHHLEHHKLINDVP